MQDTWRSASEARGCYLAVSPTRQTNRWVASGKVVNCVCRLSLLSWRKDWDSAVDAASQTRGWVAFCDLVVQELFLYRAAWLWLSCDSSQGLIAGCSVCCILIQISFIAFYVGYSFWLLIWVHADKSCTFPLGWTLIFAVYHLVVSRWLQYIETRIAAEDCQISCWNLDKVLCAVNRQFLRFCFLLTFDLGHSWLDYWWVKLDFGNTDGTRLVFFSSFQMKAIFNRYRCVRFWKVLHLFLTNVAEKDCLGLCQLRKEEYNLLC